MPCPKTNPLQVLIPAITLTLTRWRARTLAKITYVALPGDRRSPPCGVFNIGLTIGIDGAWNTRRQSSACPLAHVYVRGVVTTT
jgi:hypothetical protein